MNRTLVVLTVLVHLSLTLAHGVVHAVIPVGIPSWQMAYVGIALIIVPLTAVVGSGRYPLSTAVCLVLAGLTGLALEGPFHFVLDTTDHVANVADGRLVFTVTAVLTTASDLLLVSVGCWLWRVASRDHTAKPQNRLAK